MNFNIIDALSERSSHCHWFRANVEQDGAFNVVSRVAYEFAVAAKEAKLYGDLR